MAKETKYLKQESDDFVHLERTSSDIEESEQTPSDEGSESTSHESEEQETSTTPSDEQKRARQRTVGAGVISGIFGFLLGGPMLGALFGIGAAYASEKEGPVGESARTMGDIALSVSEEAKEIDKQIHVVDKTKKATSTAVEKAKGFENEHHTVQHTKDFFVITWDKVVRFVHSDAVERTVVGIGKACYWAADKVTSEQSAYGPFTTAEATNQKISELKHDLQGQESAH